MRRSEDFRRTVRHGVRAGRRTLVVHAWRAPTPGADPGMPELVGDDVAGVPEGAGATTSSPARTSSPGGTSSGAQIGFVVSKAVGSAVHRNRVRRRLRHLCVPRLAELAPGTLIVVRALPPAASAGAELGSDLDAAWRSAQRKLTGSAGRGPR